MWRLPPWLLVLAVWAAVFLPALGSFEIKGEEGRRILPAIAMLESGNYLVPRVGGDVYLHKPPLINWLVAASFKVFGKRNEWSARAPSVLCILAVAAMFVTVARRTLGRKGSTIAALVWLTNLGLIGKGRSIEIEALYVSLCALAMILWFSWWQEERSPWLTWLVPSLCLGLGWLAKGPTHLIFFYALVIAAVWQTKRWRSLFHPAHLIGILLMLAIFAAWAIPFMHMREGGMVMDKWRDQFAGRVTGQFFHLGVWILTIPRALSYFLPWLLVVPFIRFKSFPDEEDRRLARALAYSVAVPLIVVGLIPGAAARYTLPVLTPFCWLMGMTFAKDAFKKPGWLGGLNQPLWSWIGPAFVGLVVLVGLVGYPAAALAAKRRPKVKNIAEKINVAVPPTATLFAVDPNYQLFFFYIHSPVIYVGSLAELPYETHYFLVRPEKEQDAIASRQWAPGHASPVLRVTDFRDETVILFIVNP